MWRPSLEPGGVSSVTDAEAEAVVDADCETESASEGA
jgi:hypothetical protein